MLHLGWKTLKRSLVSFGNDDAMTLAASVAFYSALSLSPLLLLFVSMTGMLGESRRQQMVTTISQQVAPEAGRAIESIASQDANAFSAGLWSAGISVGVLIFSASGVFAAFQNGLNRVWNVRADPEASWWLIVKKRLLSIGMIFVIGFLLLVSMIVTSVIDTVVPPSGWAWKLLNMAVSFGVFIFLFAMLFKVLPDVKMRWSHVWFGAFTTALLFALGQYLIGLYIANASYQDRYGAAGSLVALLVWVYYSAIIVFFGAELTQAGTVEMGQRIAVSEHAVREPTAEGGGHEAA